MSNVIDDKKYVFYIIKGDIFSNYFFCFNFCCDFDQRVLAHVLLTYIFFQTAFFLVTVLSSFVIF